MEFTARMIADLVGGTLEGDENAAVNSFAGIDNAHSKALTFLANPQYTHFVYETESPVVLVPKDFKAEKPIKSTIIRVDNPYNAVATLMTAVDQILNPHPTGVEQPCFISQGVDVPDDAYIGAFAYIGKGVKIGRGAKIYPHAYLGDNVSVGEGTVIYSGVKIYKGVTVGKDCIIHSGAVIGADGFGFTPLPDGSYRKIPQLGSVTISDNVEIGANTTIDRATMGMTTIASGTKVDNLVQVAHNVAVGANTVMSAQVGIAGSSQIGDNCIIAGQVGVAGHIRVGNRVTIGAQSGIPNNVKDDSKVMGYPAVPGQSFARQAAMLRRLPDLFDKVKELEKKLKDNLS